VLRASNFGFMEQYALYEPTLDILGISLTLLLPRYRKGSLAGEGDRGVVLQIQTE
jgi:hypothetical protein